MTRYPREGIPEMWTPCALLCDLIEDFASYVEGRGLLSDPVCLVEYRSQESGVF